MSEVTRNTGFARGLFDDVESDSGKVKDKASKVAKADTGSMKISSFFQRRS